MKSKSKTSTKRSSSSDSANSSSSPERTKTDKPKSHKMEHSASPDRSQPKKRKPSFTDSDNEAHDKDRKRKYEDSRGSQSEKNPKNDDDRDRRHRHRDNEYNSRHDDRAERYRPRRGDFRPRRENNRNYDDYNRGRGRFDRNSRDDNRNYRRRRSSSFDHANARWGKNEPENVKKEPKEKEKPNFSLSGKLTEERNTFKGVVIKYSEPPEARKPKRRWRLYPFKGEKALQTLYIHRESAYLIGRDRKVVDLPVDHPSCSKQHAALQYRLVPFTREDGSMGKKVRPYLIDLESANGTFINNKKIDSKKYVELIEKDVIKFGFSSREYVLLHENSKDDAQDDDVKQEDDIKQEEEEVAVKQEPE